MGEIIQFPRRREVAAGAMAEAVAEILAQTSAEVSRLIYAHEHSSRFGTLSGPRGLYECVQIATEAAVLDVKTLLTRLDAVTRNYTGDIA